MGKHGGRYHIVLATVPSPSRSESSDVKSAHRGVRKVANCKQHDWNLDRPRGANGEQPREDGPGSKRYPRIQRKAPEADEIVQLTVANHERLSHVEMRAGDSRETGFRAAATSA